MLAERSPQSGVGEWAGSSAAHGQSAAAPATDAPGAPASSTPAAGAPKLRTSSGGGGGGGGSSSFTMPDPTKFTSPADVSAALRSLSAHSASLDVQLAQKITHAVEPALKGAQQTVIGLEPTLDAIAAQVDGLKERFAVQARTADDISAELRKVAARRKRVSKALEWARQVQELKTALQLLVSCIERRDWDGAVTHCQAAMAIDPVILNSNFAAKVIPTSDFPDPPPHILLNMREELLRRFTVLFNTYARGEAPAASPRQEAPSATPSRDPEQATRFFKLFPQIGWREEGLQVYADFAGSLIRDYGKSLVDALGSSRSKDAPLPHPQLLTSLFEPMARLVSTHQPLVDKHYGDGEFARGVMPALQSAECDRLGLRILESWLEERTVARKLDEVRQYAFRYLTLLRSRPVQYTIRLNAGPGGLASGGLSGNHNEPDRAQVLLGQSKLLLEMEKLLRKVYVPMELWFLRISIEKAHRLDGPDPASAPLSTPLPDDVFYVVRAVLARILSTCPSSTALPSSTVKSQAREVPVTGVEIVVVTLKAVEQMLVEDYLGVIQRRLQGVWIAASGMMSVDGPRKEAASREMRTMFVTYLNVLETSATYVDRLSREIASPQALLQTYTPEEVPVIIKQLQSIANLSVKFRAAAKTEMDLLFTQLVRPRFRPILLDAYRDVSYVLNDDSYAEAEYSDLVRRRFIKGWETVVVPYRNIFSEANYDAFIVTALEGLVRPWEKLVMGMRFTELGALRFDKDIRGLSTYLASQTAVGVRNKFARLQQISYVLSLDPHETEEEVYESGVTAGMVWSLLLSEIRAVKALRLQR
ncbi:Golgi transport complex subunit 4 [Tilletia horrida]|nr:Golgi transport complex subunit 4 [Tilletia horrida]